MTKHPAEEIDKQWVRRIHEPFPDGESVSMVVDRVGDFLREVVHDYESKTVLVIGHRATRYAIQFWNTESSLEAIVSDRWQWLEIPIWQYEVTVEKLARARASLKKGGEAS